VVARGLGGHMVPPLHCVPAENRLTP